MQRNCNWIIPSWPAPSHVRALTTVRYGQENLGGSRAPYDSFNVALHVDDDPEQVKENRKQLQVLTGLPSSPLWLTQVHGIKVVDVGDFKEPFPPIEADASVSFQLGQVCVVMSADCLPVLLCNRLGTRVAAIHAGWKGLAAGIIEETLEKLQCLPNDLMAWMGPAIGPNAFEVQEEVLIAFRQSMTEPLTNEMFKVSPRGEGFWMANLYALARARLRQRGVQAVYGGDYCTYSEADKFYSYRRDKVTGRMASLIWLE